jgi:hypothetical protein
VGRSTLSRPKRHGGKAPRPTYGQVTPAARLASSAAMATWRGAYVGCHGISGFFGSPTGRGRQYKRRSCAIAPPSWRPPSLALALGEAISHPRAPGKGLLSTPGGHRAVETFSAAREEQKAPPGRGGNCASGRVQATRPCIHTRSVRPSGLLDSEQPGRRARISDPTRWPLAPHSRVLPQQTSNDRHPRPLTSGIEVPKLRTIRPTNSFGSLRSACFGPHRLTVEPNYPVALPDMCLLTKRPLVGSRSTR